MTDTGAEFRYRLAGLHVRSDFALAEGGEPLGGTWDDPLAIEDGLKLGLPAPEGANSRSADARRVRVFAPGIGRFLIEDGRRVVVWPSPGVASEALSQHLTGPVLAIAMMQRGVLVLHGSVVGIGGRAIVILGHTGEGKSTTAAACAARGHQVLSDDLAPVDLTDAGLTVRPTSSLVRLADPDTAGLPGRPRWQAADKTVVRIDELPVVERMPVAAIARLCEGDRVEVRRLGRVEAALVLVEHAFCRPVFQAPQAAAHLTCCAQAAARCPVVSLARPSCRNELGEVVSALERLSAICP